MSRESPRLRWPLMAVSVALVGLALPTIVASAAEARVVVASSAPVPTSVMVVHRAITTSFDVTLTPRGPAALTNYIASLSDTARSASSRNSSSAPSISTTGSAGELSTWK